MFEIVFDNAKVFKDCIDALVTLIDEGEFDITNDGMKLRAMDPSQIAMVDFVLPKSAFEKYSIENEMKIGLNLEDLSKITSRARLGEKLTLKLDKSKSRLELLFKAKSTRKFSLSLLDAAGMAPKQPKIDFDAKVRLSGSLLKEGLKDATLLSAYVVLKADKYGFMITSSGDKGEVIIEARKDEDILIEHSVSNDSKAMFPLEYLNNLLKNVEPDVAVTLNLKNDTPLKLEYPIAQANVTYYLAPRIENA